MTARFAPTLLLALALPLAACGKPDAAALARGDAALKGQVEGGQLGAVASRPVMVGAAGPRAAACAGVATPASGRLAVRWSASAAGPAKAEVEGEVAVCEADGAWSGIVFPAWGQSLDDCYTATPVGSAREYQGPCRWGWVETRTLAVRGS